MKRFTALLLTVALAAGTFALLGAKAKAPSPAPAPRPAEARQGPIPPRVVAYYFHTSYRCASCRTLEANSKEAMDSAFAGEIKSGRLAWKVVNIDAKGNGHFAKDYQLFTKSLVLVREVRGKRAAWKNLSRIWELLNDKPAFLKYVREETRAYLGDAT
ncbi:MAG: hypothetical protein HZB25_06045 [Candidatus Eisenbacteria bacterium]|nr:hypothetical protein [Candidatus Eisenbacteria bacterium]